jgi:hypothetical protein
MISWILTWFYIGCEESYYHYTTNKTKESDTLNITTKLCKGDLNTVIKNFNSRKYTGSGTLTLTIFIVLCIYAQINRKK